MISLVELNHRFKREKLNEVKNWDLYKLIYKNLPNINLIWRNLWLFYKISKQILVLEKKYEWPVMTGFEPRTFWVLSNSLTIKWLPQFFQLHFERKIIFHTDIQFESYPSPTTATGLTILGLKAWIAFILWNGWRYSLKKTSFFYIKIEKKRKIFWNHDIFQKNLYINNTYKHCSNPEITCWS